MPISPNPFASWSGKTITVSARSVPRYAWTTASIDVAVGDKTILRTGGVFKIVGSHIETFESQGALHTIEISWGTASLRAFPFSLRIDETRVLDATVPVQNWWLSLWPWALIAGIVGWLVFR